MTDILNTGELKLGWRKRLEDMSDDELYNHCEMYIWLSAFTCSNPHSDFHFLCDTGYDEAERRGKLHIYNEAHENASRT